MKRNAMRGGEIVLSPKYVMLYYPRKVIYACEYANCQSAP